MIKIGTQVSGTYHDHEFLGEIIESRVNTMDHGIEYKIRLDAPFSLYGTERQSIIISDYDRHNSIKVGA